MSFGGDDDDGENSSETSSIETYELAEEGIVIGEVGEGSEEEEEEEEEGDDVEEVDYDGTRAAAHEYLDMGDGEHVDRYAQSCDNSVTRVVSGPRGVCIC